MEIHVSLELPIYIPVQFGLIGKLFLFLLCFWCEKELGRVEGRLRHCFQSTTGLLTSLLGFDPWVVYLIWW